jgi:hypothetical protein
MNWGSFFFVEIILMMSSFSPRGIASDSISVTNPYLYSLLASSAIVLAAVVITVSPQSNISHRDLSGSGQQSLSPDLAGSDPACLGISFVGWILQNQERAFAQQLRPQIHLLLVVHLADCYAAQQLNHGVVQVLEWALEITFFKLHTKALIR